MSQITEKHTTTLCGDTSLTTINQWSTTISSNPIIIKFSIKYIFNLLSQRRFPNESMIQNKSALIYTALNNYISNQVYCYNDCSGHGRCILSSYFQFGICICDPGYPGFDCSIASTTAPSPQIQKSATYNGRICLHFVVFKFLLLLLFRFLNLCNNFLI